MGKAIALALAEAGYDIALHYNSSTRSANTTAKKIRSLGVACETFQTNLAQMQAFDSFFEDIMGTFPNLNVLVNSASGYVQAELSETQQEDYDFQFALNLRAPYFLSQSFAKKVGAGNIINILDNKIDFNQPQYAAYVLTKKALADFTKLAALEFAPDIRVNGVAPGVVLPAGSRSKEYIKWRVQAIPLKKQGKTSNITDTILHLLENDFISGQILVVDGGESITNEGLNSGAYHDQSKV
ncbi:MAG: SDR family NAD(P)-dependent oxidoreductase [Chloroflexi bacterium]|nr:MAG: SDR family NAD(P)-dependent oxidoreductase [Chloroflexota bacterium]MBL1193041.1 SDR family oxidoreductase [Chloroflexota bacterium]NOH10334.1 SDR family oxidoreductase [Chloroflexota bacterium]